MVMNYQTNIVNYQRVGLVTLEENDRVQQDWLVIKFEPPFDEGTVVMVMGQPQDDRGGSRDGAGLRIRNITIEGFELFVGQSGQGKKMVAQPAIGWVAYGLMPAQVSSATIKPNAFEHKRPEDSNSLIIEHNKNLQASDRQLKYNRMGVSAYGFYRGTNHLFWSDFGQDDRVNQFGNAKTKIWIQGDLHLGNFGAFANSRGEIIYDLNDFDEAIVADYQYDLWRLAVSLVLIARESTHLSSVEQEQVVEAMVTQYLDTMAPQTGKGKKIKDLYFTKENTYGFLQDFLDEVQEENSREELLEKWTNRVAHKRFFDLSLEKLGSLGESQKRLIIGAFADYLNTLINQTQMLDQIKVKDVAARLGAGVGSLGTPRYYILIEDHQGVERILDVKRQVQPTPYHFLGKDEQIRHDRFFAKNEAQRVTVAAQALIKYPDPWLGWLKLKDGDCSVRELSPFKEAFDPIDLRRKTRLVKMAKQLGQILGYSHLRADKKFNSDYVPCALDKQINKAIGKQPQQFCALIQEIAIDYAEQVTRDWQNFKNHFAIDPNHI
jgi:uncharacterized protein (DUF2252 family)